MTQADPLNSPKTLQIVPDRKITDPSKQAQDEELGENLWRLSEQIIEEKLGGLPYKEGW